VSKLTGKRLVKAEEYTLLALLLTFDPPKPTPLPERPK
jgi:hypothetical protein